jgi:DUF1680 family protein
MEFYMKIKRVAIALSMMSLALSVCCSAETVGYQLEPVNFTDVKLTDGFWYNWQQLAENVTVEHSFKQCERTNKIKYFEIAAGLAKGQWASSGPWDDSDVFKVVEGASYVLALEKNPQLDAYLDSIIAKIAAAQEPDGYLYTWRRIDPNYPPNAWWASSKRWGNEGASHELYNAGHLFEAAVAHYQATGKRSLLDVAVKYADLISSEFGPGRNQVVPGHQEIELALVRLYKLTGKEAYLKTAEFFLENRGGKYGADLQGHKHVAQQFEAVGHVVRAMYQYTGMADVASILPHPEYYLALDKIWSDMVTSKIYITGAMGSKEQSEAFGEPYELPNRTAYTETCGSVGSVFFNHRMFLRDPDAKYIDVLERSLYNGVLSGIGIGGNQFSYRNPLESDPNVSGSQRGPWHDCPCCPTNLTRFLPSMARYAYATSADTIYLNLFMDSATDISLDCQKIRVIQKTNYPWDGRVEIAVQTERDRPFTFRIRIPGWAMNKPVPSDLYSYTQKDAEPKLTLNGRPIPLDPYKGYIQLNRIWKPQDKLVLELPMSARKVVANPVVEVDRGRLAIERGPIVYCFESLDNGPINEIKIDPEASLTVTDAPEMLGGIHRIDIAAANGRKYTAIPYYARSNRKPCEMIVWVQSK